MRALLLTLCAGAAAAAHVLTCSFTTTVTAGAAATCDIELRDDNGDLFGDGDEVCKFVSEVEQAGTQYADSGDATGDVCPGTGDAMSPFSYRGSTGLYRVTFQPTVAGAMAGAVRYLGASGPENVGTVATTVQPAAEDPEKLLASCAHDSAAGVTCTTVKRDAYNNVLSQCDQTWADGGGVTCTDLPQSTGTP